MMALDTKEVSFHEAGHAVVGWVLGGKIKDMTVIPKGLVSGCTNWEQETDNDDVSVMLWFASDLAEQILREDKDIEYSFTPEKLYGSKDFEMAHDYNPTRSERILYYETRAILLKRWVAVEALAKVLEEKKTLPGQEAEEILRKILTVDDRRRLWTTFLK